MFDFISTFFENAIVSGFNRAMQRIQQAAQEQQPKQVDVVLLPGPTQALPEEEPVSNGRASRRAAVR